MLYLYVRHIYCEQHSILFGRRTHIIYTLMHKKIPVVELTLDDTSCVIIDIKEVMNPAHLIKPMAPNIPSKPFKDTHGEQISLVRSFDWLDVSALDGIADEYRELIGKAPFVDEIRCDILCEALHMRTQLLKNIIS